MNLGTRKSVKVDRGMNLNLSELKIIERLLENRINAAYDIDVDELLHKVRKEIKDIEYQISRTSDWSPGYCGGVKC